jgi:hypothetical protein
MAKNEKRKSLSLLDRMAKLNPGLAEQSATLATPYTGVARKLAADGAAVRAIAEDAKEGRKSLWSTAKDAIAAALAAGHNPASFAIGFQIACEGAGVPSGTFRGYISPLKGMLADVERGELTPEKVEEMTVADARAKYEEKSDAVKRREALLAAWKELTEEQQTALVELATTQAAGNKPAEGETQDSESETQEQREAA